MSLIPGHGIGVRKNPSCAIYEANIKVSARFGKLMRKKPLITFDLPDRVPARLPPDWGGETGRPVVRRQREVRDGRAPQRAVVGTKSRGRFQSGKSLIWSREIWQSLSMEPETPRNDLVRDSTAFDNSHTQVLVWYQLRSVICSNGSRDQEQPINPLHLLLNFFQ